MAIIDRLNDIAYRMEDAVMQGSSPEVMERIRQDLRNEIAREKERQIQHFLATALTNIYCGQICILKRDISKLALGDKGTRKEVSNKIREELLQCLFESVMFYFDDDYSLLMDTCVEEIERRKRYHEEEDVANLPYS